MSVSTSVLPLRIATNDSRRGIACALSLREFADITVDDGGDVAVVPGSSGDVAGEGEYLRKPAVDDDVDVRIARPRGVPADQSGRFVKTLARKSVLPCVRSAALSGHKAMKTARPASDSDRVGTVRKRLDPDRTNCPGRGSSSTVILIARISQSPPRCTSSMSRGGAPSRAKLTGSSMAASASWRLSSVR